MNTWDGARELRRELGLGNATLLGLGSILGTGAFVSLGLGAGLVGEWVPLAALLAGAVALGNALSSAQLAAAWPTSGGTYEYGHRWLHPTAGFLAGVAFLVAKSASAATAALGFAGYVGRAWNLSGDARTLLAVGLVLAMTALVAGGMRRSARANALIVALTLVSLVAFVLAAFARPAAPTSEVPFAPAPFLEASALLFVAYTGYGRVATLGEEVRDPRRTIPRAILTTLGVSALVYVAVSAAGVRVAGPATFAHAAREDAAPLAELAQDLAVPGLAWLLSAGALCAMAGVLLNLILGLSRVMLAMGRRVDVPRALAEVSEHGPRRAVACTGGVIVAIVLVAGVGEAWSLSAFTVLVYYALTNAAALRLAPEERLYPRAFAWWGLASCAILAFQVQPRFWITGSVLLAGALLARALVRRAGRGGSGRA